MYSKVAIRTLRILILLGSALFAQSASATFHLWTLSELYSNASGTVQYIELSTFSSGQEFLSGHAITASQGTTTHTFNFPTDLPGDTAGHKFLIGTQGFADLGIVTPDYVVPNGFLFQTNGIVNFAGVDSVSYGALPVDGVNAMDRSGARVVNAPTNFAGATGTIPAATPTVSQGLWWNPNESGWGLSITQHRDIIFAAIYTYDLSGQPSWYVISRCLMSANSCTGDIYRVSGGTSPLVPWNGSGKIVTPVGLGTLTFSDSSNGMFNFIIDGVAGSKVITQQIFAVGANPPAIDFTDLWWNPNESGWGVALSQEFGVIFAAWFAYDANGNAIWYTASGCVVSGNGCSGDLFQVNGGSALTAVWNGANKIVAKVGSVSFAFGDSSNGIMSYTINGVAGARAITRQPF